MTSPANSAVPPSAATAPGRPTPARAASWALGLALVALGGGIAAMAAVGVTVGPMEAASGYYFADTPGWYQAAVVAGFGSLLLWTVAGLVAIVLAVLGLREARGRTRAIIAIVLAVFAPVLAAVALFGGMLLGTALL